MAGSSLTFRILGDADSAVKAMRRTHAEAQKATSGIRSSFKKLVGFSMGLAAVGGVGAFFKDAIGEASNYNRAVRQTNAVLASTGHAANLTGDDVAGLAEGISKVTAINKATIQSGENLLLTFTNIRNEAGKGNDVFDQTTKIMADMSVALGEDTKSAAIQLGKALNDPIRGVTALRRVGVSFTKDQQAQIKSLVDSGHAMDAQKLILRELTREFGGSAAAQATSGAKLKNAVAELEEKVGQVLLPVIKQLTVFLSDYVVPAFAETFKFIQRNGKEIKIVAVAVGGMWVAWKGYTVMRAATAWFTLAGARYRQFAAQLSYGNRAQRAASSGMRGMAAAGKVLGPLTVALAAATYGVSKLADDSHHASGVFLDYSKIVGDFRQELIAANGAINDSVRLQVGMQLQQHGLAQKAKEAGISLRDLEDAVTGNDEAMGKLFQRWTAAGHPSDESISAVIALNHEFHAARSGATELTGSLDRNTGAAKKHVTAEQRQKDAVAATDRAIRKQKQDLDALVTSILAASSNKIAAAQAELQFRDGLAGAKQQVKENGKALDANTAKGRANREWLLEQVGSLNDVANAQLSAGVAARSVAARWAENVRQLREAAKAAGLNKTQVDNLVGSMTQATRRKFRVKLDADLSSASQKLRDWKRYWEALRITLHASMTTGTKNSDPRLGGWAAGTNAAPAGWAWVGERGPELMRFKGGEQVLSHPNSMALAGAGGYASGTTTLAALAAAGGVNVRVFIGNEELRDIARVEVENHAGHQATLGRMRRPS